MATATHTENRHAPAGPEHDPLPNDPTHDVNGRAVVTWVLAWTAILFLGMYGLLILFDQVLDKNRQAKIENVENTQLQKQRAIETAILDGQLADGKHVKSIEQTMQEMAKK